MCNVSCLTIDFTNNFLFHAACLIINCIGHLYCLHQRNNSNKLNLFFVVSLSACTSGIFYSWNSPSIPILISGEADITITFEESAYLVIIPAITSSLASPIFPIIMDVAGRKISNLLISIPYIIAWILIMTAKDITYLYWSKILVGVGDAAIYTATPTYISEISTPDVRGFWGNSITIAICIGQIIANAIGGYLNLRLSAFIYLWIQVAFTITFVFMPETPYYLLMKGRTAEAKISLQKLRMTEHVDSEFAELCTAVQRQSSESGKISDLITNKTNRKALLAGLFIRASQHFSGVSIFSTYTGYIFQQAGGSLSHITSAIIYNVILVVANIMGSFCMDRIGRKLAMMISSGFAILGLAPMAIYFYLKDNTEVDVSSFNWVPLGSLLVYVMFYAVGLGLVPGLITGELFSTSIKAKGTCVLTIFIGIFSALSVKIFQSLVESFGMYAAFVFFIFCCLTTCTFSHFVVPETKGLTLEEIQQSLKAKS